MKRDDYGNGVKQKLGRKGRSHDRDFCEFLRARKKRIVRFAIAKWSQKPPCKHHLWPDVFEYGNRVTKSIAFFHLG